MESFFIALNAIVPFVCYVTFGYMVRSFKMVDEAFLKKLNQVVFKAFFPILMFDNLYGIQKGMEINLAFVTVAVVAVLAVVGIAWIVVPKIIQENPKRGTIIQALFRSNTALFMLPFVVSVFGEEHKAAPTLVLAVLTPVYNVLAVIIFEAFRGGKAKASAMIKGVLTNPMILGAAVGLLFNVLGIKFPACIEKPIDNFSNLCTPLGMFVLGGTLRFSHMRDSLKYLIPTTFIKMVVLPAVMLTIGLVMGVSPVERFVLLVSFAAPIAASSYPMAQNMGGDGELAGEFVVFSTVLSVFTLFVWIVFMGNVGILY